MRLTLLFILSAMLALSIAGSAEARDTLRSGESLSRGEELRSSVGEFRLVYQTDGNLVVYFRNHALWASRTPGVRSDRCVLQGDGNLVIYRGGHPVWASGTAGHGPSGLLIQGDGNLVIYRHSDGRPVWSTSTHGRGFPAPENVRNAIAGILEGQLEKRMAGVEFRGEASQTHKIRIAGGVVGSYTNTGSFRGFVRDPIDLDIATLEYRVDGTRLTLYLDLRISGTLKGSASGKIRNLGSVTSNATGNVSVSFVVRGSADVSAGTWDLRVNDMAAKLSELQLSNDALNWCRGYFEKKANENVDSRDLEQRANEALSQVSGGDLAAWIRKLRSAS